MACRSRGARARQCFWSDRRPPDSRPDDGPDDREVFGVLRRRARSARAVLPRRPGRPRTHPRQGAADRRRQPSLRRGRGGRAGVEARSGAGGWASRHQAHRELPPCGVCRFETAAHPGRPVLQLVVQRTGAAPSDAARAGRRLPDRVLSRRGVHTACPQPLRPQHEPSITDSNNIPTT